MVTSEHTFIVQQFRLLGTEPDRSWIGLTDDEDESIFRWLNNAPLTYETWHEGFDEPNGRSDQNCVLVHHTLKWIDVRCGDNDQKHVLCSTPGEKVRSM